MTIIYRGTLTKEKLKELANIHFGLNGDDAVYNPAKNHQAISIIQQPDGNWVGEMWKGKLIITERQIDPNTVVTMLITHE